MPTFGELLSQYIARAGISDAELARTTGVQRQTIFRWKEGLTARPRYREDILRIAAKLRLSPAERDALLLAGGFSPDDPAAAMAATLTGATAPETPRVSEDATDALKDATAEGATAEGATAEGATAEGATAESETAESAAAPSSAAAPAAVRRVRLIERPERMLAVAVLLMVAIAAGGAFVLRAVFPPPTPAPAPTPIIVSVSAPTVAPTSTPPPTATPIVAQPGEQLIVIAPFVGYTSSDLQFNVAGRIREALQEELARMEPGDVQIALWPAPIADAAQADAALNAAHAVLVIWGEYDAGRVRAGVSTPAQDETYWINPVDAVASLPFVINEDVPRDARTFALYALGGYWRSIDQPARALAAYERALAQTPGAAGTRASLHFYVGLLTPQVHGYSPQTLTRAIEQYSAALALEPAWENVRYNRGTSYLGRALLSLEERADLDAAIADLTIVSARRPARVDPLINRGIAYYQRNGEGDLDLARVDFDRAVALQPENFQGYYHRALVAIRAGDRAGWQADLAHVRKLAPDYAPAHNALCWAFGTAGEAEEALAHCDAAVAADSGGASLDSRAITLAQLGRQAEAAADLRAYLDWVRSTYPALYTKYRGPQVEEWIAALARGENPFTPALLATLRKG